MKPFKKKLADLYVGVKRWYLRRYWKARVHFLGEGAYISGRAAVYQASRLAVGRNSSINDFVHIWAGGGVSIGDESMIAAHCAITSVTHDSSAFEKGESYRITRIELPVRIGKNVWIGSGVTILPGVCIGDNSIVGAGSVVTKSVDANTVVAGVPAKMIRTLSSRS